MNIRSLILGENPAWLVQFLHLSFLDGFCFPCCCNQFWCIANNKGTLVSSNSLTGILQLQGGWCCGLCFPTVHSNQSWTCATNEEARDHIVFCIWGLGFVLEIRFLATLQIWCCGIELCIYWHSGGVDLYKLSSKETIIHGLILVYTLSEEYTSWPSVSCWHYSSILSCYASCSFWLERALCCPLLKIEPSLSTISKPGPLVTRIAEVLLCGYLRVLCIWISYALPWHPS